MSRYVSLSTKWKDHRFAAERGEFFVGYFIVINFKPFDLLLRRQYDILSDEKMCITGRMTSCASKAQAGDQSRHEMRAMIYKKQATGG